MQTFSTYWANLCEKYGIPEDTDLQKGIAMMGSKGVMKSELAEITRLWTIDREERKESDKE